MIATTGFVGWENTSSSAEISFSIQSPKKLGRNLGSPLKDACFLCEAANASFIYTCPILLSSCANLLSFSSSCGKNLIFSNKNISSSCLAISSSSLLINLTFLFIFFSNSLAIGSIDKEISILPLGRPLCVIIIILAPILRRALIVGIDSSILVVSTTTLSFVGTL